MIAAIDQNGRSASRQNGEDARGVYTQVPNEAPESGNAAPEVDTLTAVKQSLELPQTCVDGTPFQVVGAVVILMNALVIGLETDLGGWEYWEIVENSFLGIFTSELLVKMYCIGPCTMFCGHPDAGWSAFDFFIVGLGIFDFTMSKLTGKKGVGSFATIFRIMRLLRILRIFRIVKFLKQLYVLAFGLVEAVKAVFWVTVLMLFVLYVCSIVLVKTIGRPPSEDPDFEFLDYHFGCIPKSMLSLFILMSSPNLPEFQSQEGLLQSRPALTLFLCAFVIFGSFGIVALLTGVISESMFEKNEVRKAQVRAEHEAMRKSLGDKSEALFCSLPAVDANGEATVEMLKVLAPKMHDLLEQAGAEITHADVERIIEFMDVNGTGLIGSSEFRGTMEKIAEGLSTLGVQEIANRVGICETKIDKTIDGLDALSRQVMEIQEGMQLVLRHLESRGGTLG